MVIIPWQKKVLTLAGTRYFPILERTWGGGSPPPRAGDFLYRDVTWAAKIPLLYRNTWKDRSD